MGSNLRLDNDRLLFLLSLRVVDLVSSLLEQVIDALTSLDFLYNPERADETVLKQQPSDAKRRSVRTPVSFDHHALFQNIFEQKSFFVKSL